MRRDRVKIGSQSIDIDGNLARGLHGVDVQQAAMGMNPRSHLRNRLNNAGLVVGQHHGDQRARPPRQGRLERIEVDQTGAGHRNLDDRVLRKSSARQHRRMLDRRQHQPLERLAALTAGRLQRRAERQRIGFGAATGENHLLRRRADQRRHLGARGIDDPARRPPLGMDRGWVHRGAEDSHHRVPGFRAQRRCRVPVGINPFGHRSRPCRRFHLRLRLAENACFSTP